MSQADAIFGALRAAASQAHRSLARPHRAPARRPRRAAQAPAAGRACRGDQRQGLDHRLHARRARGGGKARPRLHLAPSGALQRAHSPRRRAGRRRAPRRGARSLRGASTRASRSPCSRSRRPRRCCCSARRRPIISCSKSGLGGRFDATNVIDAPAATIITPVSFDHPEFLGDTVEKIAYEKAGILRRGAPAIIAEQEDGALRVIEREALRVGAPRIVAGRDFFVRAEHGRLIFEDHDGLLDLPLPRLPGRHQHGNAATRDRGAARDRAGPCRRARSNADSWRPTGPPACNACAAGRSSRSRPRRPKSGSTAPITKRADGFWPKRWPISRISRRARWR